MTDVEAVQLVQSALRELGLRGEARSYDPLWVDIDAACGDVVVTDAWTSARGERVVGWYVVAGDALRATKRDPETGLRQLADALPGLDAAMRASADEVVT